MPKATQEEIQNYKSALWWIKLTNLAIDNHSLKNNVFFKMVLREFIDFLKLSEEIKKANCLYKNYEIDEQLDENEREKKNILGEIVEESNLFLKKIDEEGENEKKLKNNIIEMLKLSHAFFEILDEEQK